MKYNLQKREISLSEQELKMMDILNWEELQDMDKERQIQFMRGLIKLSEMSNKPKFNFKI